MHSTLWRRTRSALNAALLGAMLLLAVAVKGVPWAMGGAPLVVLSGSMEPAISAGDVIAVGAIDPQHVRVGDIVTFQPISDDPTLITHRVVAKSVAADGGLHFVTQGDDNSAADKPIVAAQLKGAYLYRLPGLGLLFNALGGVGSGMVMLIGAGLIGYATLAWMFPGRSRRTAPDGASASS